MIYSVLSETLSLYSDSQTDTQTQTNTQIHGHRHAQAPATCSFPIINARWLGDVVHMAQKVVGLTPAMALPANQHLLFCEIYKKIHTEWQFTHGKQCRGQCTVMRKYTLASTNHRTFDHLTSSSTIYKCCIEWMNVFIMTSDKPQMKLQSIIDKWYSVQWLTYSYIYYCQYEFLYSSLFIKLQSLRCPWRSCSHLSWVRRLRL